jgi:hypothetical protein
VSIEELEETIQDHREFLLNLDSHKAMALSINFIGQLNPLHSFKGYCAKASSYVPSSYHMFYSLGFFISHSFLFSIFFRTIHSFLHPFAEGPLLFPHCSPLSRGLPLDDMCHIQSVPERCVLTPIMHARTRAVTLRLVPTVPMPHCALFRLSCRVISSGAWTVHAAIHRQLNITSKGQRVPEKTCGNRT